MSKEEEYLANAADSLELAERATLPDDRRRLFRLAEAWLDLAARIRSRVSHPRKTRDHPLVKAKLGNHYSES
jgi:hypothetical protein